MTTATRPVLLVTFIAACAQNAAGPSAHDNASPLNATPTSAKTGVNEQIWDASRATDGSCVAVPRCEEVPGTACTSAAQTGTVRFVDTACIGAATRWEIVRHSGAGDCSVQHVSCKPGASCVPPTSKIACPAALVAETGAPTEEPQTLDNHFSVTAAKNMEKGHAALARKDYAAAKRFYDFVITRYPRSSHIHDAELGLLHVAVAQAEVVNADTTNGYCNFIEHHPWHASVQSGELACRVDKLQGRTCQQGAKMSQYCGKPSYCAAGVTNREGCQ
jgi:hypothetical protein